jgi:1-acyl-sn-glycerol-3-phosphate acyltransferase
MTFDQWRRGAGTALSFGTFGLGGLLIGVVIAPLMLLCVRNVERRRHWMRRLIQQAFRGFIGMMRILGVVEYELEHIERLQRRGLLVLANHPSLIDVIFLVAHTKHADCIVNGALASNPFTRGPIKAAGYITNRDPEAVIDAARDSLARGNSLILFPEGTRTTPGNAVRLRRGGANIALRTGTPVTPVIITCTPATLTKGEPWYHIPARRIHMELRVMEDVPLVNDTHRPTRQLAREMTSWLDNYFNNEVEQFRHERDTRLIAGNQAHDHRHIGT